ncbi:MAG: Nif3-like dinuclear metal center hexameric protein [Bacteroidetes bacterium]|nr:Nif3-like dinuclear metal center hexameric protein [Bacteroidota bacterium]
MYTRREFLVQSGGGVLLAGLPQRQLTIQDVINLIMQEMPYAPLDTTVDSIKSGDPQQPVRAIITTFTATHQLIEFAARQAVNMIITHESIYYNHEDDTQWLDNNDIFQKKRQMLEDSGIVVWRLHDAWHNFQPDGILTGVLNTLGWQGYADADRPHVCTIPSTSLAQLSQFMKTRFKAKRIRVIGDAEMSCQKIGLLAGSSSGQRQIEMLSEVDVLVVGEVREWETTEFVRDANWQGDQPKGLIVLGHALSEEPGMKWLADWLTPRLPSVIIAHQASGDPFYFV